MRQLAPKLYIGTIADFGDAAVLQAAGVELAVAFSPQGHFAHAPASIGALAIYLVEDASHPAFMARGCAKLLTVAYNTKVLALCDVSGGVTLAAYMIVCALAEKNAISWNMARTTLRTILWDERITDALAAQGRSLWP